MKRNEKGQFSTEHKKDFRIRVTKEEKEMIENFRQNKLTNDYACPDCYFDDEIDSYVCDCGNCLRCKKRNYHD